MDHQFHQLPQYTVNEIFSEIGKSEILAEKASQMALGIANILLTDNALHKLFEVGGKLSVEYDFYHLRPYLGELALDRGRQYNFIETSIEAGISSAFSYSGVKPVRPYDIEPTYPPRLPYFIFATVAPQKNTGD